MSRNFISFSCISIREQLTLFLDELEVQKSAHAQNIFSRFALFKTTKKSHSIFNEMKISF